VACAGKFPQQLSDVTAAYRVESAGGLSSRITSGFMAIKKL
jgi:hypothetical protein